MFDWIEKLRWMFAKKASLPLSIISLTAEELKQKGISYADLFDRKYDAVIIRNFYSPGELALIENGLKNIPADAFTYYGGRYKSMPPVFEKLRPENAATYFTDARAGLANLSRATAVDFERKNYAFFETLVTGGVEVTSPGLKPGGEAFPAGCIRIIPPSYGIIRIHADNDFYRGRDDMMSYFRAEVDTSNHVSYIALIRRGEQGGNLVLHHIDYADYDTITDKMEVVHRHTKEKRPVSSFESTELQVNEGDLVLFSGGQIWHSVNQMKGSTERVTYGGFSAFSTDRKKIYLWT